MTTKVWIGDLAEYNSGNLTGEWFEFDGESEDDLIDEIQEAIKSVLLPENEEYYVGDTEGYYDLKIDQYIDIEHLAMLTAGINKHEEAFATYVGVVGDHYATLDGFDDSYRGEYPSKEDYAEEFTKETGDEIPKHLEDYIDYDKMASDWEYNGDVTFVHSSEHTVFVFDN